MQRIAEIKVLILDDIAGKPYMQIDSDPARMTLWGETIKVTDTRKRAVGEPEFDAMQAAVKAQLVSEGIQSVYLDNIAERVAHVAYMAMTEPDE